MPGPGDRPDCRGFAREISPIPALFPSARLVSAIWPPLGAPDRGTALAFTNGVILCAVDLGPLTGRVLFHAYGLSKLLGTRLLVLHVSADDSAGAKQRVLAECERAAPYEADIESESVIVATGRVSEVIQREALRHAATLIVVGSRGHGGLTRLLLGSTSEALLGLARTPVLLVPPTEVDIVSMGERAALTCGPLVAPIDLTMPCEHQLQLASRLAQVAGQPLVLMTVARSKVSDHDAAAELRDRGRGLEPVKPTSLVVRRGDVAEEISRCAVAEGAGLVVMGLRQQPRGRPGLIASAVLKTGRAFVLAVPGC